MVWHAELLHHFFKYDNRNASSHDFAPMMIELAVYGLVTGLCEIHINFKNEMPKLYISLIIAMLAGRIVNGLINTFVLSTQGYTLSVFMTASFITCLPGIIIQLIIVPILVRILNKTVA